jgi:FixJ family two-component response regulator
MASVLHWRTFMAQFAETRCVGGARGMPRHGDGLERNAREAMLPNSSLISMVDDDESFRDSMRRLMKSLGYTAVEVFASAADFLASPRIAETACLITDVHMPAMTGVELYRHLMESGRPIPTILVTAYPDEAVRVHALSEGIICYLRKPIDENQLMRCIRSALDRPGQAREGS